MHDLTYEAITYVYFSWDIGKISLYDKILTENLEKKMKKGALTSFTLYDARHSFAPYAQ